MMKSGVEWLKSQTIVFICEESIVLDIPPILFFKTKTKNSKLVINQVQKKSYFCWQGWTILFSLFIKKMFKWTFENCHALSLTIKAQTSKMSSRFFRKLEILNWLESILFFYEESKEHRFVIEATAKVFNGNIKRR